MNYSPQKINTIVISILALLTLFVSVIFSNSFPQLPVISDSADYHEIASRILTDKTYVTISSDAILYPPMYPIFLSAVYTFTDIGDFTSVYTVQYLLVGMMAILVFLILRKFARVPLWLAILASLITLFWPYFMLYSQLVSSEIVYSFLLLLFFYLFLHVGKESSIKLVIASGIILGLALLTRPVALLMLPWILIGLFVAQKLPQAWLGEINVPWKKYLLILVTSVIVLIPWITYVKIKYDRFIPIASNLSYVFKKANTSMGYLSPKTSEPKKVSLLEAKTRNIYLFWDPGASGYHLDIIKQKYPIAGFAVLFYKIFFFIIVGLATIGAIVLRKNRLVLFSLLLITYFWAVHTVLFPFPRYTLPIIPYVVIVAVVTFTHGTTYWKTHCIRRLAGKERSADN